MAARDTSMYIVQSKWSSTYKTTPALARRKPKSGLYNHWFSTYKARTTPSKHAGSQTAGCTIIGSVHTRLKRVVQKGCTKGLYKRVVQKGCTNSGCTKRLNKRVVQKGCTKGLYKRVVQEGCTRGLYKRVVQKGLYKKGCTKRVVQKGCTKGLYIRVVQKGCTKGLYKKGCTKGLYIRVVQSVVQYSQGQKADHTLRAHNELSREIKKKLLRRQTRYVHNEFLICCKKIRTCKEIEF